MKARSLRFALVLSALLLVGLTAASEVATANLGGATLIQGTARATDLQIVSHGLPLSPGVLYEDEHACHNACQVTLVVTTSAVFAAGPSDLGNLPPYKTYELGDFRGRIGITTDGLHDYRVHLDGTVQSYQVR